MRSRGRDGQERSLCFLKPLRFWSCLLMNCNLTYHDYYCIFMLGTVYIFVPESKVSKHVCLSVCMCLHIFGALYICKPVCLWV